MLVVPTSSKVELLCSMISGTRKEPPISTSSPRETMSCLFFAMVPSTNMTAAALLLTTKAASAPVRRQIRSSTWLYRLTVNAATDVLRRRRKEPDSLDDAERPVQAADSTDTPEEAAQRAERRAMVRRAIGALSENHRQILLLREVTGLSYEEIGAALELSPGTVRSRLARARKELREELLAEGNYFDLPPSKGEKGR